MPELKLLLIEDNMNIARQLVEFLHCHQWQVEHAATAHLGLKLATEQIYDLVLLDLNLPDMDGLEVCQQLKQTLEVNIPVLMLTARDSFEDKARGFGIGADDYLTKPFDLRELVLRAQALARRQQLYKSKLLTLGELELDLTQHKASRLGQSLKLTGIGFKILCFLAQQYPQPVSRSLLSHHLWGENPPDSDALKSHIYALRNALDKPFSGRPMLVTITNLGFKLSVEDEK